MFDFSSIPYYDNHTHLLFTEPGQVTPEEFAFNYYHGLRAAHPETAAVIDENLRHQSVILSLVHALSERFGCEETLEGVTAWRNAHTRTAEDLAAYTRLLFEDAGVAGCTLDAAEPIGDPRCAYFPCRVTRLFRYEDVFFSQLKRAEGYHEALDAVLQAIRDAKTEGFSMLKGHIGEKFGFDVYEVSDEEAEAAWQRMRQGDQTAVRPIYYAMFGHILELSAELDMPVHLHTGTTGFKGNIGVAKHDPMLMVPFLKNPRYERTKLVLLHASFPFTRNAAWLAYNFPNVYVDLSQTGLWQGPLLEEMLRDLLSVAPHNKILLGTGQHWYCEMVWLAARSSRRALEAVMERLVGQGLYSRSQAEESARLILSGNALRLYRDWFTPALTD